MEIETAIKVLKTHNDKCLGCDKLCDDLCKPAIEIAIEVMKEIEQYRNIGTLDELTELNYLRERYEDETYDYCGECGTEECGCKNKLKQLEEYKKIGTAEECGKVREKQIAKKPILDAIYQQDYYCPNCEMFINRKSWKENGEMNRFYKSKYCRYCGQHIDWSDKDDRREEID